MKNHRMRQTRMRNVEAFSSNDLKEMLQACIDSSAASEAILAMASTDKDPVRALITRQSMVKVQTKLAIFGNPALSSHFKVMQRRNASLA